MDGFEVFGFGEGESVAVDSQGIVNDVVLVFEAGDACVAYAVDLVVGVFGVIGWA